ncbi:MAG: hypothetical protein NT030_02210, partial [Candidatus Saganbacteria bacterium]|nr:hypothetical protein [Candidatus Saganbacteria bacterium]
MPKEAQEAQEELHYERSHDDDENLLPDETKERLKSIDINENKAERLFKILEGKLNAPDFISFLKEISSFSYPINPKLVPISRKIARTYLTNDTNKKSGMNIYIENLNSSDPLVQKEAKEALIELGATLVYYMLVLCSSENNPDLINIYKEVLKNDNLLETFFYSFYKYNTELENTTKHNIITIINEVDQ